MIQPAQCPACETPFTPAKHDYFVERPTGYTLVRRVAVHACPTCGEICPVPAGEARIETALARRRQLWSSFVSPTAPPDFRALPGERFLALQAPAQPRLHWSAGKVVALLALFAYLFLSLLSDSDARMLRVALYAAAALALIWFSKEFGARFNMPGWTGFAMGWFLLTFPMIVLSAYTVVYWR